MRQLLMLLLLLFSSFSVSNSTQTISDVDEKERFYYEYKVSKQISRIRNLANRISGSTNNISNTPVGLPINPNSSTYLSSKFGKRQVHPVLKVPSFHEGIDIAAVKNTPVIATADGKVVRKSYDFMGYGKLIELKHGNGISTFYAHLNSRDVDIDEKIEVGDTIGTVGSTGLSTGNHLHYEVRKEDVAMNPLETVPFKVDKKLVQLSNINKFIREVQMETNKVTKNYTLAELKDLKDDLTNKVNVREYNLKYNKVKKLATVENSIEAIKIQQKNLIKVKDLLAKANTIEFENEDGTSSSNNSDIFRLALLRDLKRSLNKLAVRKRDEEFNDFLSKEVKDLDSEISKIDKRMKEFNTNTKVEVELVQINNKI